MSSGASHAQTAKVVYYGSYVPALVASAYSVAIGFPEGIAISVGVVAGCGLGWLITPDIDQDQITYEERRLINRLGWLGWLWHYYWMPYALFFRHARLKHDQSAFRDWSHRHVLGTATRFVYLLWAPMLITALWVPGLQLIGWLTLFIGWSIQDSIHITQDKVHTFRARRETRKEKRSIYVSARPIRRWRSQA